MPKIALLGWGSLLWERRPDFEKYLEPWAEGGPRLPIEFSRVSETREDALTLVIDRRRGTEVETLYAFSKRKDSRDAVCDLRSREGTSIDRIGFVDRIRDQRHGRDDAAVAAISAWAAEKDLSFVVWTDLDGDPKFSALERADFVPAAIVHLHGLNASGLRSAVEYIINAPPQTDTELRRKLMQNPWFLGQAKMLGYAK